MSQATTRQPSLITPLTSLLSVLVLTGKIIDFNLSINRLDTGKTNRSFQQQEKRWSTVKQVFITSGQGSAIFVNCVYAAPCRQLAWGKRPQQLGSLSPDRTSVRRDIWLFVRLPNVPNVTHILPVGSRLNPF